MKAKRDARGGRKRVLSIFKSSLVPNIQVRNFTFFRLGDLAKMNFMMGETLLAPSLELTTSTVDQKNVSFCFHPKFVKNHSIFFIHLRQDDEDDVKNAFTGKGASFHKNLDQKLGLKNSASEATEMFTVTQVSLHFNSVSASVQRKQPEMKAKRLSRAQRLDIITTLPQNIIEIILCLLPIEEAARTSILSREWRFKWTKIPKLVFDNYTVKRSTEKWNLSNWNQRSDLERKRRDKEMRCKLFYAIHQVLLQHQGPIQEFSLSMQVDETCFEIDQIILHLARNHTLKRLTLAHCDYSAQDWGPGEFPPTLINLKYFCIEELCFGPSNGFAFLGVLFKCSPNLEKIRLEIETDDGYDEIESTEIEEEFSLILEKYSNVWLEHLSELEILHYRNEKLELDLLKFILARSPNLKKVKFGTWMFDLRKDLKMLKTLLRPPRASPLKTYLMLKESQTLFLDSVVATIVYLTQVSLHFNSVSASVQQKQPEMKAKRSSRARRLSKARQLDIITTLPQNIIEIILCLLPIEEAART
ncbi:hypothetical protein M8C21_015515, partial [Ambrosia artemisiifolia]